MSHSAMPLTAPRTAARKYNESLSTEKLCELLMMAAELVELWGEECQPLMDYWAKRLAARQDAMSAVDRARAMVAAIRPTGT